MPTRDLNAESVEYDAILASALFAGETNSKRFLRFVCDKHFAGIHNVTEYEIGVEALGRRADFDPGEDSIVRVEAHRIRKRLREYYEQEGSGHKLWLVIPHGSYMPHFVPAGQARYESHDPGSHGDPARLVSPAGTPALAQKRAFGKYQALLLALICVAISIAGFEFYTRLHPGQWDNAPKGGALTVPSMAASSPDVLIMAGSTAESYTDQLGHVWTSDRFFNGGNRRRLDIAASSGPAIPNFTLPPAKEKTSNTISRFSQDSMSFGFTSRKQPMGKTTRRAAGSEPYV